VTLRDWRLQTASPAQTRELGRILGELIAGPLTILLSGDLGAGKTCLVQGLARGLGVPADEPVTSPSYTLMNLYRGRLELCHFDLYRLSSAEEVWDLGLEEYLHGERVTVLEWAERLADPGGEGLSLHLAYVGDGERDVTIAASGRAAEEILDRLVLRWRQGGSGA